MGISLRILAVLILPLFAAPDFPCLCFLHEAVAESVPSACCTGAPSEAPAEPVDRSCEGCVCLAPSEEKAPLQTSAIQAAPTASGVHLDAAPSLGNLDVYVSRSLRPSAHAPPPPPLAACVLLCVRLT